MRVEKCLYGFIKRQSRIAALPLFFIFPANAVCYCRRRKMLVIAADGISAVPWDTQAPIVHRAPPKLDAHRAYCVCGKNAALDIPGEAGGRVDSFVKTISPTAALDNSRALDKLARRASRAAIGGLV